MTTTTNQPSNYDVLDISPADGSRRIVVTVKKGTKLTPEDIQQVLDYMEAHKGKGISANANFEHLDEIASRLELPQAEAAAMIADACARSIDLSNTGQRKAFIAGAQAWTERLDPAGTRFTEQLRELIARDEA